MTDRAHARQVASRQRCSYCRAGPGVPCKTRDSGNRVPYFHRARIQAAFRSNGKPKTLLRIEDVGLLRAKVLAVSKTGNPNPYLILEMPPEDADALRPFEDRWLELQMSAAEIVKDKPL